MKEELTIIYTFNPLRIKRIYVKEIRQARLITVLVKFQDILYSYLFILFIFIYIVLYILKFMLCYIYEKTTGKMENVKF